MVVYNQQVIQMNKFKNKKFHRSQVRFERNDDKFITIENIKEIYHGLINKRFTSDRIAIVGMNSERLTTIISRNEDDVFDFVEEEYLKNKPAEIVDMLSSFEYIDVLIYPQSPN
jgi:hypothetical protein